MHEPSPLAGFLGIACVAANARADAETDSDALREVVRIEGDVGTDALLPVYRYAETEERFRAQSKLPPAPSSEIEEVILMVRAMTAARERNFAELAAAARDIVVHARKGAAAGWRAAAETWLTLYRFSNEYSEDRNHDWDERMEAERIARDALREAAFSFYAACRSSSDPVFSSEALGDFSIVQAIREEYISAELALLAVLKAGQGPDVKERPARILVTIMAFASSRPEPTRIAMTPGPALH